MAGDDEKVHGRVLLCSEVVRRKRPDDAIAVACVNLAIVNAHDARAGEIDEAFHLCAMVVP